MRKALLILSIVFAHSAIAQLPDTATLNSNNFKDSLSVRKLIDTAYAFKEAEPVAAIKLSTYAYNRAIQLNNLDLQGAAINVKASVFTALEDFETGLKLHYEALKLFEKTGNNYSIGMLLNNIGRVYSDAGKMKEAMEYLHRSEAHAKQFRLDLPLLFTYVNKAAAYIRLNDLKAALDYSLKADTLNGKLNQVQISITNNNTIGALYYFMTKYDLALAYYARSRDDAGEINDSTNYYRAIINMAEVYEITHQEDPLPLYLNALRYFETNKIYSSIQYVASDITNYYKTKGNYKLSLQYYERSVAAGEKNKSLVSAKHMQLLQTQYETEKKEQEISLLNKENTIQKLSIRGRNNTIFIISALFVLSIVIGWLIYNRYKYRQKTLMQQQALLQREELTKAVIDAEEKERKRIASDLHDGLGQLFSAVKLNLSGLFGRIKIDRDEDRFVAEKTLALVEESCKEVRIISHQMMPNMLLRSGIASDVRNFIEKIDSENLKVNLEANGFKNRIESSAETVLYRVIQESVNNVIKHSKASRLDIILNRDEKGISVQIIDNGIGFDPLMVNDATGIGLKNIKARIEYLKGTVHYDTAPGNGTTVDIWVPL